MEEHKYLCMFHAEIRPCGFFFFKKKKQTNTHHEFIQHPVLTKDAMPAAADIKTLSDHTMLISIAEDMQIITILVYKGTLPTKIEKKSEQASWKWC